MLKNQWYGGALKDFESIFGNFSKLGCMIPHDKVFALLGLVSRDSERHSKHISVDYDQNLWSLLYQILHCCQSQQPQYFAHAAY
ncbi:hypothetical protein P152DRAFT_6147 [Eremomyces bilateralis CBS 781.70]|uniref:Uncharacterized protein n=1 Tax=Eremomyces bilateralis CBS 781.70 TaxID=1392243 RepID=A0A6G1GGN0_9PEZI|nr:uncharacterized protein P152DRAFT_6147 [Eremomyces bilateralis CBS 781.70]KAF1817020.1 hypothetical protein P152DRAFT_6147 [Eremomyces bilateralis CBS 781.70]